MTEGLKGQAPDDKEGGRIMHQQGGTIENALRRIESHEYVLPAIQREFVWQPEQVCNLFDSLMQGYPFGEFMLCGSTRRTLTFTVGTIS